MLLVGEGLAPPSWFTPAFVAAAFRGGRSLRIVHRFAPRLSSFWRSGAHQKERSPGSLPGFVWFRVPKSAPLQLANLGGGLGFHCGVGICGAYYGDLSWCVRRGSPKQFTKQPAVALGKRFKIAQQRANIRRAGLAKTYPCQSPGSWNGRLGPGLHLNGPVHRRSSVFHIYLWTRATCPFIH